MNKLNVFIGICTYGGLGLIAYQTNWIVCVGVFFALLGFTMHYHFNVQK